MPQRNGALHLYVAHRGELLNYANRILGDHGRAEEVVQDAWERFNAAFVAGMFDEPRGYLYRIVRNLSLDRRRRARLEAKHMTGDAAEAAQMVADETPSVEAALVARSELDRLREAIAELPDRTRIAMEMHRFGGCTLREIAAHLGISTSRTHVLVMEGLSYCRSRLTEIE